MEEVLPELLRFIGSRPLVGYYLEFDVAMLNRHVRRLLGIGLPNAQIEVSGTYYERKYGDAPPGTEVDLTFVSILEDLGLPTLDQHDAYSDALMTAMMHLKLEDLKARDVRIPRARAKPVALYGGGVGPQTRRRPRMARRGLPMRRRDPGYVRQNTWRKRKNRTPDSSIAAGRVSTQASAMLPTVDHCMPEPLATIVPATPDDSTWVVDTGRPKPSAAPIVAAATSSAAAPWP